MRDNDELAEARSAADRRVKCSARPVARGGRRTKAATSTNADQIDIFEAIADIEAE
jgi:hypothetical protein